MREKAGRESALQALMLILFYSLLRLHLVWASGGEASLSTDWVAAVSFDAAVLAVGVIAVGLYPSLWILRCISALLYLLVLAGVQFYRQTGAFASSGLLTHAIGHIGELWPVLTSGLRDRWLSWATFVAAYAWLVPPGLSQRLPQASVRYWYWPFLILLPWLVLGQGMIERSLSLFGALARPHAVHVIGEVPEYPVPRIGQSWQVGNEPPDVLILILESVGAKVVPGFSGGEVKAQMPWLGTLMQRGRLFDAAYTTTSHTSKALVGILCGMEPAPVIGIVEADKHGMPADCLPKWLGAVGYRSLYLQSAKAAFENRSGLVTNMGFHDALYREQIEQGFQRAGYFGVDERALLAPFRQWWRQHGAQPRFAVVLTSTTHHPYQQPGAAQSSRNPRWIEAYLDNLNRTDAVLGEIVHSAEEGASSRGLIVVVTGDHGEAFGEHGLYQHDAVPYQEVIRVPLWLRMPTDGPVVVRDSALRSHLDLMPTLLSAVGTDAGVRMPGLDLLSPSGHAGLLTFCWGAPGCSASIGPVLKWIHFPLSGRVESYHLEADPREQHDLAARSSAVERARILDRMQVHAASLRAAYAKRRGPSLPSEDPAD